MSDLVKRLRGGELDPIFGRFRTTPIEIEAADEIDRLQRELAEALGLLREAMLALDYCQMKLDEYVVSGQYTDDSPLIARIYAFLAATKEGER